MATVTELPEVAPVRADDDDFEIDHLYCCDEERALCGMDLTGIPEVGPNSKHPLCPLCALVEEQGRCPRCGE